MTNWRSFGDMTYPEFQAELHRLDSPMAREAAAIYAAVKPHSRLFLAMSWMETKHSTLMTVPGFDVGYKNPVALMTDGQYVTFRSYALCAATWLGRLTSPTYKDGIYAKTETLEELVHVYAPYPTNDEARYVEVVTERLRAYGYEETAMPTALRRLKAVQMVGCTKPVLIPEELEFRVQIIPASQTNQRPGGGFTGGTASYYTQHETGNPNYGAGAQNHSDYLHNGALARDEHGNLYSQQLGYHLTLDDHVLCQMIPLNEKTWHAGDAGGPGNFDSIACELCVNVDSDRALSRELAAIVAAGVMNAIGIPQAVQHNHWTGKHCPEIIREIGYWPVYLSLVAAYRKAGPGEPAPVYAPADTAILDKLGAYDGTDKVVDGTTFFACQRTITARRTTKRLQVAAWDAPSIGPDLKKGDEAPILYIFQAAKGGSRFALTQYGTRLKLSHFTPYVTFTAPKAQ